MPNAGWSGISTECEGKMRWADDVIETEDLRRGYACCRHDPGDRDENVPTKQDLPQNQRVRWPRSRDMRLTQRESEADTDQRRMGVCSRRYNVGGLQETPVANGADVDVSKETHDI